MNKAFVELFINCDGVDGVGPISLQRHFRSNNASIFNDEVPLQNCSVPKGNLMSVLERELS